MMGGVNNAQNYYEKTMKFGHKGPDGPIIDNTLLQGGIVSGLPGTDAGWSVSESDC